MTDIKLCINCKHSQKPFGVWECHHPQSDRWKMSPVDGKISCNLTNSSWKAYCENAREHGKCGHQGAYFEKKDPEISWFKKFLYGKQGARLIDLMERFPIR